MEGGLRKNVRNKRVGALRGGWRVECEKMCKIKRVRRRVECEKMEGWGIKGQAEGGLRKNVRNKRIGALRGRRRVDCEKMCEIKRDGALKGGWREDCEKSAKLRS